MLLFNKIHLSIGTIELRTNLVKYTENFYFQFYNIKKGFSQIFNYNEYSNLKEFQNIL